MIDWNRSEAHLLEGEGVEGQEIPVATLSPGLWIDPRVQRLAKGQRERIDRKEAKGRNAVQGQNSPIVRSVRNGPTGQSVPISQKKPIDQNELKEQIAQIAQIVRREPSDPKESAGQNEQIGRTELAGQNDPKVQIVLVDQSVPKVQIVLVDQKGLRTVGEAHEMIAADAIATLVNPVPETNVEICRHIPNRFPNQPDSVRDCTMMMMTSDFAMSRFFWNKKNSC